MSNLDYYLDLSAQIQRGELDDKLVLLKDKIEKRLSLITEAITLDDFTIGERVQLNKKCKHSELRGKLATVVAKKRVNMVITLDEPTGRWAMTDPLGQKISHRITVPLVLVDKITE